MLPEISAATTPVNVSEMGWEVNLKMIGLQQPISSFEA